MGDRCGLILRVEIVAGFDTAASTLALSQAGDYSTLVNVCHDGPWILCFTRLDFEQGRQGFQGRQGWSVFLAGTG